MNTEREHSNAGPHAHPHHPRPKKWHQDWRIWVMVLLMLGAIGIYVLTLDLR